MAYKTAAFLVLLAVSSFAQESSKDFNAKTTRVSRQYGYLTIINNEKYEEAKQIKSDQNLSNKANSFSVFDSDGSLKTKINPKGGGIRSAAISKDGKILLTVSPSCYPEHNDCGSGFVPEPRNQLFDSIGNLIDEFFLPGLECTISPNGRFAMVTRTGFEEEQFQLIDLKSKSVIQVMADDNFTSSSAEFTNDNKIIFVRNDITKPDASSFLIHIQLYDPDSKSNKKKSPTKSMEITPPAGRGFILNPGITKSPAGDLFAFLLTLSKKTSRIEERSEGFPRYLMVVDGDLNVVFEKEFDSRIMSLKFSDNEFIALNTESKEIPKDAKKIGDYAKFNAGYNTFVINPKTKTIAGKSWVNYHQIRDIVRLENRFEISYGSESGIIERKTFIPSSGKFENIPAEEEILLQTGKTKIKTSQAIR